MSQDLINQIAHDIMQQQPMGCTIQDLIKEGIEKYIEATTEPVKKTIGQITSSPLPPKLPYGVKDHDCDY